MNNLGNINEFMSRFGQFRQQMQGQNPDQLIQRMMSDGRLTQAQYNAVRQRAAQIEKMIAPMGRS